MIGLVVTTVNKECESMLLPYFGFLAERDDAVLYIVGDVQHSPVIKRKNVISLTYEEQQKFTGPADFIHTRTGTRRVIGYLKAVVDGCDYILAIDDDNVPVVPEKYIDDFLALTGKKMAVTHKPHRWVNMIEKAYSPAIFPRGFSAFDRKTFTFEKQAGGELVDVPVFAGLWEGDPDVDAVERLAREPGKTYPLIPGYGEVKSPDSYCSFNTQNTLIDKKLLPALYMESTLRRYDDIWMSYICQAIMKPRRWGVYYGTPYVVQARNPHNYVVDLKDELFGLEHTPDFVDIIEKAAFNEDIQQHVLNVAHALTGDERFKTYGKNLASWVELLKEKVCKGHDAAPVDYREDDAVSALEAR